MSNVKIIPNWINGVHQPTEGKNVLEKFNPHTGELDSYFVDSAKADIEDAISAASVAFAAWSSTTPVSRGNLLHVLVKLIEDNIEELASIVSVETGKPLKDAVGEVNGSILQGKYFAGEGMRLYGRSLTSGMPGKYTHTVRKPIGIAGLIVPANTPIANIAWKIFPALICGNTVVLKASEDAPGIAVKMAELAKQAGLPDGVLNIVQGRGNPAGMALVEDKRVDIISFTGSTEVGRWIAKTAGNRLARVSLELGGKNPFVVCDDADITNAVDWAILSAFSNAGQRCAAGSRILVFEKVYDEFVEAMIAKTKILKLGIDKEANFGPVINQKQHTNILNSIRTAREEGGEILVGGNVPKEEHLRKGYYVEPTLIAGLRRDADLSMREIFGPVATLYKVTDIHDALALANHSEYGLTAAIHTKNVDRAVWFAHHVKAGTTNINIGTFGSEPHMPFGGFGASGNGTREPGVEALDVYSELKTISFLVRETLI